MFPIKLMLNESVKDFRASVPSGMWDKIAESAVERGTPRGEVEVTRRLYQMHESWESSGRRIYEITPELAAAFAETEFPLSANDIQRPHAAFYVASPRCGLMVSSGDEDLAIDGWYVDFSMSEAMQVLAVSERGHGAFAHVALPMDVDIEDYLKRGQEDAQRKVGKNADQMALWTRIVAGTCAYLASERPSVDRELYGKRREHRENVDKKKLAAESVSVNYFRVGDGEKWAAHFGADAEMRKLTRRHVVRGHYRRLAAGRTTWVRPYWKGPEWGEMARAVVTRVE